MYEAFYNLIVDPFRLLPDDGFHFPHRSFARAWAFVRYAMGRGEGIVVVTGEPGAGKTILAQRLLRDINRSKTVAVRLVADGLDATELLRRLAYGLGLAVEGMDRARLSHVIERYLLELELCNRSVLVVIDEAHTMSHDALEAMRLLTDIQSRARSVMQLFLFGRESLEGAMQAEGMEQFQQRVVSSCRLASMTLGETKSYLEHRLATAGWRGDPAFDGAAVFAIHRFSLGSPRHVNKIGGRLLLHGCIEEKHELGEADVLAVVGDLRDELLVPVDNLRAVETPLMPDPAAVEALSLRRAVPSVPKSSPSRSVPPQLPTRDPAAPRAAVDGPIDIRTAVGQGRWLKRRGRRRHLMIWRALYRKIASLFDLRIQIPRRAPDAVDKAGQSRAGAATPGWLSQRGGALLRMPEWLKVRDLSPSPALIAVPLLAATGVAWVVLVQDGGVRGLSSLASVDRWVGLDIEDGIAVFESTNRYLDSGMGIVWSVPGDGSADRTRMQSVVRRSQDRVVLAASWEPSVIGEAERSEVDGLAGLDLVATVSKGVSSGMVGSLSRAPKTMDLWLLAEAEAIAHNTEETEAPVEEHAAEPEGDDESVVVVVRQPENLGLDFVKLLPSPAAGVKPGNGGPVAAVTAALERAAADAGHIGAKDVTIGGGTSGPAAATLRVSSTPAAGGADDGSVARIERLLKLARRAFDEDKLTLPSSRSAAGYYRQVLSIEPGNQRALYGLGRVVERYTELGDLALGEGGYEKAERYAKRANRVLPGDRRVSGLMTRIEEARAEEERLRLAAAEAAARGEAERIAAHAAALTAAREAEEAERAAAARRADGLNRLMRNVD